MATPVMKRLMREAQQMAKRPVREYHAYPLEDNLLEWHFTLRGPDDSPYAGGLYHGRVLVPTNYPYAPPDVVLITPNGRFELEKRICLSISSYHPENWQSTWGISTVLVALRDFMLTPGNNGIGAVEYPAAVRKELAIESREFKCPDCGQSCAQHVEIMDAALSAAEPDAFPATPLRESSTNPITASPLATTTSPVPPSPMTGAAPATASPPTLGTPTQEPAPAQQQPLQPPVPAQREVVEPPGAPPAPIPAPALALPPPVAPQAVLQRRGNQVELQLSAALVDRLLYAVTIVIAIIMLKKLLLDVPRETTDAGVFARWIYSATTRLLTAPFGNVDDVADDF